MYDLTIHNNIVSWVLDKPIKAEVIRSWFEHVFKTLELDDVKFTYGVNKNIKNKVTIDRSYFDSHVLFDNVITYYFTYHTLCDIMYEFVFPNTFTAQSFFDILSKYYIWEKLSN
jgi:hypothetical protein